MSVELAYLCRQFLLVNLRMLGAQRTGDTTCNLLSCFADPPGVRKRPFKCAAV